MQFNYAHQAHRQAGIPIMGETWANLAFADQDMAGIMFHECSFVDLQLVRMDFSKCVFNACRFERCAFLDCTLHRMQMAACTGSELTIAGGRIEEVVLSQADLSRLTVSQTARQLVLAESRIGVVEFRDAGLQQNELVISGGELERIKAVGACWSDSMSAELDFSTCEFGNGRFERTSFVRADAKGLDLSQLEFHSCNLYRTDFSNARLRHAESSIFAECALPAADLRQARLDGALFAKVQAEGARFDGASLNRAMFPKASLAGASFSSAVAVTSVFEEADLTGANFTDVDATGAVFRNACLVRANVDGTSFVTAHLHGVEGSLDGADLRDSQGTIDWRAEREREARGMTKA